MFTIVSFHKISCNISVSVILLYFVVQLKFKKEDVIVPEVPGPFTSILIRDKEGKEVPVFVALESFIFPRHYGLFMGYDKPLDLQLTAADVAAAVEKKRKETGVRS